MCINNYKKSNTMVNSKIQQKKEVMNIFPDVTDWKDLQNKICLLLNQIGLIAECEKKLTTPRGQVEVDVYAYDPNSVDNIRYIVECKNWCEPVNQSVIHSFTTVMNETGCNIGYIVSKNGFQSGAANYVKNTNIKLFTFNEIQSHYYRLWMINYFARKLERINERCNYYCEPCNIQRDRAVDKLNDVKRNHFFELYYFYGPFIVTLEMVSTGINYLMKCNPNKDYTEIEWESLFLKSKEFGLNIASLSLSEILTELEIFIIEIEKKFDDIFGYDIFA